MFTCEWKSCIHLRILSPGGQRAISGNSMVRVWKGDPGGVWQEVSRNGPERDDQKRILWSGGGSSVKDLWWLNWMHGLPFWWGVFDYMGLGFSFAHVLWWCFTVFDCLFLWVSDLTGVCGRWRHAGVAIEIFARKKKWSKIWF